MLIQRPQRSYLWIPPPNDPVVPPEVGPSSSGPLVRVPADFGWTVSPHRRVGNESAAPASKLDFSKDVYVANWSSGTSNSLCAFRIVIGGREKSESSSKWYS